MYDATLFQLDGDVAQIARAGAEIGRRISDTDAAADAALSLTDVGQDSPEPAARGAKDAGCRTIGLKSDAAEEIERVASFNPTVAEFGKLTILKENAGKKPRTFEMLQSDLRFACDRKIFHSFRCFINKVKLAFFVGLLASLPMHPVFSQDEAASQNDKTPVSDRQLAVMMFIDYGRSFGYQNMLAQIQVDTIKAELERDRQIAKQNEALLSQNAIARSELEISQLKVVWGEKQLVVAEKNLIAIGAQYEAMKKMAQHFAGVEVPRDELYGIFRRGWDAGCDKGPDEVAAMKAWVNYSEKSLQRVRELSRQGGESLASVLEKEAQLKIAELNYQNRESRLDLCRKVLFPSREDIKAIER